MAVIISSGSVYTQADLDDARAAGAAAAARIGTIELICGYTGGVAVQPITNDNLELYPLPIALGDISSGGVYHAFDKNFFVANNIKLLRCYASGTTLNGPLNTLQRYFKVTFDPVTNTKNTQYVALPPAVLDASGYNLTTTFDIVWSADEAITYVFHDGTY